MNCERFPRTWERDREEILSSNCRKLPCLRPPSSALATDPKDGFIWSQNSLGGLYGQIGGLPPPRPGCTIWSQPLLSTQCLFQYFPLWPENSCPAFTLDTKKFLANICLYTFLQGPPPLSCQAWPHFLREAFSECPSTSVTTQSLASCQPRPLKVSGTFLFVLSSHPGSPSFERSSHIFSAPFIMPRIVPNTKLMLNILYIFMGFPNSYILPFPELECKP